MADASPDPRATDFGAIDSWIFDLDNTLYPASCNLFAQVDRRMGEYICEFLDVDHVEARRIQKQYYYEHGTTLRGLMDRHGADPDSFLDYVHNIDVTPVDPDPQLGAAIAALPGRRFVFTNGSTAHAVNVLDRLGVTALFDGIFDIVSAGYVPKPETGTYEAFLREWSVDPRASIMFEDLARNLEPPHELGMTTVLVQPEDGHHDFVHALDGPGTDAPHVHYVTDDLTGFLDAALNGAPRTG